VSELFLKITASLQRAVLVYKRNPKKSIVIFAILFVLGLYVVQKNIENVENIDEKQNHSVVVSSVLALSSEKTPLVLLGEVRSVSQAELRAQKTGEVTSVYVRVGQLVSAGTIIAEIENKSERAAVLSAQGVVAAAKAQLEKIEYGARSEDRASLASQSGAADVTLETAKDSARSAYSQAYSLAQDAVFAQADDFFSNAYTVNPSFRVRSASYDEKNDLEKQRVAIGKKLDAWKLKTLVSIADTELDVRLDEAQSNLEEIKNFLDTIGVFVSEQPVDDDLTSESKASQEAVMLVARSNVDGAKSAVQGAVSSLALAQSGSEIASLSLRSAVDARGEDVAVAQATLLQAQGALAGAYAVLENTLLRTPISGTVTTLPVTRGDFLAMFDVVAIVANEGALEIEAYVTDSVRDRIIVGTPVMINGTHKGAITSISPGLDPATKKARVTVGVVDEVQLVNGSFVEVVVLEGDAKKELVATSTELFIPITAIKVLPQGFAVFSIDEKQTLQAHFIEEGPIVGSKMLVKEGLTADMLIITDVRGLSLGDHVEVKK